PTLPDRSPSQRRVRQTPLSPPHDCRRSAKSVDAPRLMDRTTPWCFQLIPGHVPTRSRRGRGRQGGWPHAAPWRTKTLAILLADQTRERSECTTPSSSFPYPRRCEEYL